MLKYWKQLVFLHCSAASFCRTYCAAGKQSSERWLDIYNLQVLLHSSTQTDRGRQREQRSYRWTKGWLKSRHDGVFWSCLPSHKPSRNPGHPVRHTPVVCCRRAMLASNYRHQILYLVSTRGCFIFTARLTCWSSSCLSASGRRVQHVSTSTRTCCRCATCVLLQEAFAPTAKSIAWELFWNLLTQRSRLNSLNSVMTVSVSSRCFLLIRSINKAFNKCNNQRLKARSAELTYDIMKAKNAANKYSGYLLS